MHIPDGYLGPKTCAVFYVIMAPLWYAALKKTEKTLEVSRLPVLSLASASVFVIMMLNFPVPGGSTGHIVGGAMIAILLGPWAGLLSMTLVLFLQALLFGDGGITAFGANSFNMAFLMSFSGYLIYAVISGKDGKRFFAAAFIAAYLSVCVAAFATAVELGLQPVLEADALGMPLYAPYPLKVTLIAMMAPHVLFFAPMEGLATALIVAYILKAGGRVHVNAEGAALKRRLLILLAVLVVMVPLGLLASQTSFGEWSGEELKFLIGYVPAGFARLENVWKALLPDYGVQGSGAVIGYVVSALIGSASVVLVIYLWGRLWKR